MEKNIIEICKKYNLPGNATLECFVHSDNREMHDMVQSMPCMIVCPGGGYHFVSEREAEPIAIEFYNRNYNAFILRYDIAPARYPLALTQLACCVDYVRKNAETLHVDPDKIYVCGFSAGGHLVGCLANFHDTLPCDYIDASALDAKPNAVILSYPVIYPSSHVSSYKNLLGEEMNNDALVEKLTLDHTVTEKNPPCFIWSTFEDNCVRPDATLRYMTALYNKGVKSECHIFANGGHGGSTCDGRVYSGDFSALAPASVWLNLADTFLKTL